MKRTRGGESVVFSGSIGVELDSEGSAQACPHNALHFLVVIVVLVFYFWAHTRISTIVAIYVSHVFRHK